MKKLILVVRDNKVQDPPKYAVSLIDESGFGDDIAYFYDLKIACQFSVWYSTVHPPETTPKKP